MYHSFEDLEVWKRDCRLAVEVSRALAKSREYFVRDQMQRAALSSNIAEGSAAELRTQCYIAAKLEILNKSDATRFTGECKEIASMLHGLIRAIGRAKSAT